MLRTRPRQYRYSLSLLVIMLYSSIRCSQPTVARGASELGDQSIVVAPLETVETISNTAKPNLLDTAVLPETLTEPTDAELLQSVIRQNTAALENIRSLYVDLRWREESVEKVIPLPNGGTVPGGRRTIEGSSKIWQDGENYHQDFSRRIVYHDANQSQEERRIAVFNDLYFAQFYAPKLLQVYLLSDRKNLYHPVDAHAKAFPFPNMLDYGFGLIWASLDEQYQSSTSNHPDYFRWSIHQLTGANKDVFRITNTADVEGEPYVWEEAIVDGTRGFLATEYRGYERERLSCSMQCGLKEIKEGVWFPMNVTVFRDEDNSTLEIQVNEARVNEAIDGSIFTLERMDFDPAGVTMTEYSQGGRAKILKSFRNGQWLQKKMVPGR